MTGMPRTLMVLSRNSIDVALRQQAYRLRQVHGERLHVVAMVGSGVVLAADLLRLCYGKATIEFDRPEVVSDLTGVPVVVLAGTNEDVAGIRQVVQKASVRGAASVGVFALVAFAGGHPTSAGYVFDAPAGARIRGYGIGGQYTADIVCSEGEA